MTTNCFGVVSVKKKKKLNRERGTQQKLIGPVIAKSTELEDFKTGEVTKNGRCFIIRMVEDLMAKTAEKVIQDFIDNEAILYTNDKSSYTRFEDLVAVLVTELSSTKEGKFKLYWAHTVISNLKSDLRKYRMVSDLTEDILEKDYLIDSLFQQSNPNGKVADNHF